MTDPSLLQYDSTFIDLSKARRLQQSTVKQTYVKHPKLTHAKVAAAHSGLALARSERRLPAPSASWRCSDPVIAHQSLCMMPPPSVQQCIAVPQLPIQAPESSPAPAKPQQHRGTLGPAPRTLPSHRLRLQRHLLSPQNIARLIQSWLRKLPRKLPRSNLPSIQPRRSLVC